MSKRKKDMLTIIVIIILLLLITGIFLLKGRNQKTETKLPATEEQGEFVVKTEQDAAEDEGYSDHFKDNTTNQNPSTSAGERGGSKTLEIISPEQETGSGGDEGSGELIWLPDAW